MVELLASDYMMASSDILDFHEISDLSASTKVGPVKLNASQSEALSGILSNTSVLSGSADPTKTNITERGYWVLNSLLCSPPPPPPPDLPSIPEEDRDGGMSKLESLRAHASDSNCRGCHVAMDPLGSGLENFDQWGRWRSDYSQTEKHKDDTIERDFAIGAFKGVGIKGVKDYVLNQEKDSFRECMIRQLANYAFSSIVPDAYVNKVFTAFKDSNYQFRDAVEAIVLSKEFMSKWQTPPGDCAK